MMLRSFLPVGQGAFNLERFKIDGERINIVYDCGSSTNLAAVHQQIRNEVSCRETIDAVFISHLDEDHINGLPFLLKHAQVKNLFFPLITTKDSVYLKLNALLSSGRNGFLYNFIENPYSAFESINLENTPYLYQIEPKENEERNNIDASYVQSGDNTANLLGWNISIKNSWEWIPFNFSQESRIKELKDAIAQIFNCEANIVDEKIEELICNYPNDKEKIKEAYRRISGTFNTNSMTLFSGIRNPNVYQDYVDPKFKFSNSYCSSKRKNGCLYLGDYDASGKRKWEALKNAYDDYWDYIGCIQIPHHGSYHNYNPEISKIDAINIISAGIKNKYQHPNALVLKDLMLNNCTARIVTENSNSRIDLDVNCF